MQFVIDQGSSEEEKKAAILRGIDAMFGAALEGGNSGSGLEATFVNAGGSEDVQQEPDNKPTETGEEKEESEKNLCEGHGGCGEDPCLFGTHQESLMAFDESEHGELTEDDLPPNNIRRKKLYRQLTLMINGGPMGAGVREPLPTCCVAAIRTMLASETYMGFHAE